ATIAGGPVQRPLVKVVERGIKPEGVTLSRVDPWKLRLQFVDVNLEDSSSVLAFLNNVGYYDRLLGAPAVSADEKNPFRADDGQHVYGYDPPPLDVEQLRDFQAFCRHWPCDVPETSNALFNTTVGRAGRVPTMFITTASFYDAIQAAFVIDQIKQARVV